jgi:hypothetical protein
LVPALASFRQYSIARRAALSAAITVAADREYSRVLFGLI